MRIEYDTSKNAANIAKHGISFDDASNVFVDPDKIDHVDTRQKYGEERRICFGSVHTQSLLGRVFCVAYTMRNKTIRIISARKANEREQQNYYRRFE